MTLPINILYLAPAKNIHHERIIESLVIRHNVETIYGEEQIQQHFNNPNNKTSYDVVIYSPLDIKIPNQIRKAKSSLVGLCMALEINEPISRPSEIDLNVDASKAINFDSKFVERRFDELFKFNGLRSNFKYGTDINKFKYREIKEISAFNLICNRGWTHNHGNMILLDALDKIHDAGIAFCCKFIQPDFATEKNLEKYMHLINEGKVKFFGPVDETEMYKELVSSDAYISASLSDGASVSLLEAMSSGLVAIVSDFGSNLEIIEDNFTGFTFKNGDSNSLAETILRALSFNGEKLHEVSSNARKFVEKNANWKLESEKLHQVINDCRGNNCGK